MDKSPEEKIRGFISRFEMNDLTRELFVLLETAIGNPIVDDWNTDQRTNLIFTTSQVHSVLADVYEYFSATQKHVHESK